MEMEMVMNSMKKEWAVNPMGTIFFRILLPAASTLWALGMLWATWMAIDATFLASRIQLEPHDVELQVVEVMVAESADGREVLAAILKDKGSEDSYKYPRREGDKAFSLSYYFGDDFAKSQFRYGEEFVAHCSQIEIQFFSGLKEKRREFPCNVEKKP